MHLVTIIAMLIIDASIMVTKNAMNVHDEHVKQRTHQKLEERRFI